LSKCSAITGRDRPTSRAAVIATARASLTGRLRSALRIASGVVPNIGAAALMASSHTAAGPVAEEVGALWSAWTASTVTRDRSCSASSGAISSATWSCSQLPAASRIRPGYS
jgi:hypothetical protein